MPRSLVAMILVFAASAAQGQQPGPWRTDLAAAQLEAKRTGKPVLIDFGAEWCGACKLLDRQAFAALAVRQRLAAFVAVKVDCDHDRASADRFQVKSLPTLIVLAPDGKELARRTGSAGAADVNQWLAPFRAAAPPPPAKLALMPPPAPREDPWLACHRSLAAALDGKAPGGR